MGRCCVVEDTDQNVYRDEKPSWGENYPYISGDSAVRAAAGDVPDGHLSSPPPCGRWNCCVIQPSARNQPPHSDPSVPLPYDRDLPWHVSRIVGMSSSAALTCRTDCRQYAA